MILITLHDKYLNINKVEQRLIQVFAYFIGTQFLHELMYLGMEYSFKFSNSLNIENIKGNFYMSNLFHIKNLINLKFLFKHMFKSEYTNILYNSFKVFKKFYTIINKLNPILNILDFIIQVGAKSNKIQYQQIAGMRGFLNTSRGYLTNIPLFHNFERGLNLTEYIISSYGVRKGLLDTSLQTSESGYLTRRLVEVIQDIIIKEQYCGSNKVLVLRKYNTIKGHLWFPDYQLLFNKYLYKSFYKTEFYIKSPILCYSGRSICTECNGFSGNMKILGGESIGVIFGELLGEPSTQLTLRTFHTGGILNITDEYTYYSFRYNLNIKNSFNFKNISFKTKKNFPIQVKNNIYNKYKFIFHDKIYKNIIFMYNKFSIQPINFSINQLIMYKFNLVSSMPILKSYSRKILNSHKILINNILLNIYSTTLLIKNNLSDWAIFLLNNSLNYCIFDYIPEKFIGGFFLHTKNFEKLYLISNINIIY